MTMRIWAAIAVIAAIIGAAILGDGFGHRRGINEQKAADQVRFDQINKDLSDQKAEAFSTYQRLAAEIVARQEAADTLKTQLEMNRVKNQKVIDDLRTDLASRGLRFATTTENAGCRDGGGGAEGGKGQTPGAPATTIVELPRKITEDLRQLTFEADQLRIEYQRCYDWVNSPASQ